MRVWRACQIAALFGSLAMVQSSAFADNFSFVGTFLTDDQAELFQFTVPTTSVVTLNTLGYAGGTNAAGAVIPSGGFDPFLSLFDSTGALIGSNDNSPTAPVDPSTGAAFDASIVQTLSAGTYTLALTESPNQPAGTTFADGFTNAGQGDFTCASLGLGSGPFCDSTFTQRNGNWAVDILNVTSASDTTATPEPASILLFACGAASLIAISRRRRQNG